MKVGYARTSTAEQVAGLDAQMRDLKNAGCEKIFYEHASAVLKRDQLEEAIRFVREGDEFIVTRLDRLVRTVADFMKYKEILAKKRVILKILNMGIDTSTPTGELILNTMASVAQFERSVMFERQREGIDKAKAAGRY